MRSRQAHCGGIVHFEKMLEVSTGMIAAQVAVAVVFNGLAVAAVLVVHNVHVLEEFLVKLRALLKNI